MERIRRIVHPSDFSAPSRPALVRAIELAKQNRAALTLVHVVIPVAGTTGYGSLAPPALWKNLRRHVRTNAQKQLDKRIVQARQAGVRADSVLLEGIPADRIVYAAKRQRADVIVMGTHGRGALARLFLGSVAQRVVATAPCPVLTVRGR